MTSSYLLRNVARASVLAALANGLAGCGVLSVGVTEAEVQATLEAKMPWKRAGIMITAPKVQLGDPDGGVQVCAKWELPSPPIAGLPPARGDVCGAGKLQWDRSSCQVKLEAPSLTKASLEGGSQLPQRILDPLNSLLSQSLREISIYKANSLTCFLVKGVRTKPQRIEIII